MPNFLACLASKDPQIHQIFGEFGGLARPVKFCPLALCKPDYLAEGAIFLSFFTPIAWLVFWSQKFWVHLFDHTASFGYDV